MIASQINEKMIIDEKELMVVTFLIDGMITSVRVYEKANDKYVETFPDMFTEEQIDKFIGRENLVQIEEEECKNFIDFYENRLNKQPELLFDVVKGNKIEYVGEVAGLDYLLIKNIEDKYLYIGETFIDKNGKCPLIKPVNEKYIELYILDLLDRGIISKDELLVFSISNEDYFNEVFIRLKKVSDDLFLLYRFKSFIGEEDEDIKIIPEKAYAFIKDKESKEFRLLFKEDGDLIDNIDHEKNMEEFLIECSNLFHSDFTITKK